MSGELDFAALSQIITAQAISDAGSFTLGTAISNDVTLGTEITVACAYGGTATEGIIVYVVGDIDGTNFEAVADRPWGIRLAYSVSTTHRRRFFVPPWVRNFKLIITNDSGASVTVNAWKAVATAAA